jgi:hypothetical protein
MIAPDRSAIARQQFELAYGQHERFARREHESLLQPDLELAYIEDVLALRKGCHVTKRGGRIASGSCKVVIEP